VGAGPKADLLLGDKFQIPAPSGDREAIEAAQDGRIHIELVNGAFLKAGGTPDQYRAGIERAIAKGWLHRHQSGEVHVGRRRAVRLKDRHMSIR
jgi:hypothetical protein